MLQIPTWSRIVTGLIVFFGILIALPNVLPESVLQKFPSWLPSSSVSLGLDLQGGSHLLLEVEEAPVIKERLESVVGDIRTHLRKARIGYTDLQATADAVQVRALDPSHEDDIASILNDLNPTTGGSLLSVGAHEFEVSQNGTLFTMALTDAYKVQTRNDIVAQSIEVVRRRIDQLGTREPSITQEGEDRIVVEVPGLSDPDRLIKLLGTTAKMTFQMVDESADVAQAERGVVPIGDQLLYMDSPKKGEPPTPVVVQRRVVVDGERLVDAAQAFDQQTGQPVVTFRFDALGARQFGDATKDNVGKQFAIVLDNKVITDPVIESVILGGTGQITGNFTVQSANDLAILLRAGALPAPLTVLERRTVGPGLGSDSVQAGKYSAMGGLVLVALFMIARYGLFGLFADVALTLNIVLLMAALTLFGATLTLPGIAGIVLTMGMAVDANVLIYERIREEHRNGRTIIASIDSGFRRAMATIVDANATHLIASLILFQLGSGPVRGFAVTLGVGIITSFFTAVMVTRLIVVTWLKTTRPKRLII